MSFFVKNYRTFFVTQEGKEGRETFFGDFSLKFLGELTSDRELVGKGGDTDVAKMSYISLACSRRDNLGQNALWFSPVLAAGIGELVQ